MFGLWRCIGTSPISASPASKTLLLFKRLGWRICTGSTSWCRAGGATREISSFEQDGLKTPPFSPGHHARHALAPVTCAFRNIRCLIYAADLRSDRNLSLEGAQLTPPAASEIRRSPLMHSVALIPREVVARLRIGPPVIAPAPAIRESRIFQLRVGSTLCPHGYEWIIDAVAAQTLVAAKAVQR